MAAGGPCPHMSPLAALTFHPSPRHRHRHTHTHPKLQSCTLIQTFRCTARTHACTGTHFMQTPNRCTHSDTQKPTQRAVTPIEMAPAQGRCTGNTQAEPTGGEDPNIELLWSCFEPQAPQAQAPATDENTISDPEIQESLSLLLPTGSRGPRSHTVETHRHLSCRGVL